MVATYSGPSLIQLQRDQTIGKIAGYVNYLAIASISIIISTAVIFPVTLSIIGANNCHISASSGVPMI